MELYWRDNYMCPSETAYKQMIMRSKFYVNYVN